MRAKPYLVAVALVALGAGWWAERWLRPEPTGGAVPLLKDLNGETRSLAEWRGKVLVLNFWATWCPPCREELPEFQRLQEELGGQGLQFVGIAIDEPDAVRGFLNEHPVNYPIWLGDQDAPAWADRLGNRAAALPFSVVFDRAGKSVHTQTGIFPRQQVLEVVRPLLRDGVSGP
ncbi:TlpA family protein disulfide reductase [Candidatus Methylocalor cossyra]|uniref:Thiol-disulfide isomerase or thioredoxin n=1 Tax=Candidatus Methylocalor cossyra TaxID=3108543 RepID=A0ABP1C3V5_9GAMM